MPFTKLVKNDAYFSRYHVKYRRRREGKTDYYARKRLVAQAKNKYNSPKYRLVVRITNRDIIVQVVSAKIQGDEVLTAAYSHELPRYGLEFGLTNWSAAYATGLLAARRALTKLGLADKYEGVAEPDGTLNLVEAIEDGPRPFKAYLDVGLARTSTGARVFGALKGAADGGILIPHSEKRFPGYDPETKALDAEVLRNYIFGGHVQEHMENLEEEDPERYKLQFSKIQELDIAPGDLEEVYQTAHQKIREDPMPQKKEGDRAAYATESRKHKAVRLTLAQRRERVQEKIAAFKAGQSS